MRKKGNKTQILIIIITIIIIVIVVVIININILLFNIIYRKFLSHIWRGSATN